MRFKVQRKHINDCAALRAVKKCAWPHPWSSPRLTWRDKTGGLRGGTTAWFIVECNNPSCKASFLVAVDHVMELIFKQAAELRIGEEEAR